MEQQFEQFQRGLTSAFENSSKLMGPALRTNEVVIDSFSQLVKDQFAFGQACLDISRKQLETVTKAEDLTGLYGDQSAASDYYAAATQYGEALRANAENTQERLLSIGREVTEAYAGFAQGDVPVQAPVAAAKKTEKASAKTAKSA